MNLQEIIVFCVILISVIYTLYRIIKVFKKKPENSCGCSSCDIKTNTKNIRSIIDKELQ